MGGGAGVRRGLNARTGALIFPPMAVREILTVPDARLKQVSQPVDGVDDDLRALIDDMIETMYAADGIGLAAIQVGVAKRVIVMDLSEQRNDPKVFVNPVITPLCEEKKPYSEGCLSIPDVRERVLEIVAVDDFELEELQAGLTKDSEAVRDAA